MRRKKRKEIEDALGEETLEYVADELREFMTRDGIECAAGDLLIAREQDTRGDWDTETAPAYRAALCDVVAVALAKLREGAK